MQKHLSKLLFISMLLFTQNMLATNVQVTNVRFNFVNTDQGVADFSAEFTISWDNAWYNARNHDAAWVFFKLSQADIREPNLKINPATIQLIDTGSQLGPTPQTETSPDSLGFFVHPGSEYRGDVRYTLKVDFKRPVPDLRLWEYQLNVQAIEMVYIPQGGFTLGDPDTMALQFNAYYRSDAEGGFGGLYKIESEATIEVGPEEGQLYYRSEYPQYNGDQQGPIPATFPKGYDAFYCMKYELSQGQYAAFLNSIDKTDAAHRANFATPDYYKKRGTIRCENGKYVAGKPNQPLNFASWEDQLAFADWAALRPMTEFEYTKACRGPESPKPHEYPWGTSEQAQVARVIDDSDDELKLIHGYTEADLSEAIRPYLGASYYWVMDLAGSVWERVITAGNHAGRAFTGKHGDGQIGYLGTCTVEGWGAENNDQGGFGYRGGGYYDEGMTFSAFNPYSPIAYRRYGAWSGGPRYISYGFRAVRTANE